MQNKYKSFIAMGVQSSIVYISKFEHRMVSLKQNLLT